MKTHSYTSYLCLITIFHGIQQIKTKEINFQDNHGLDYSGQSNNQKKMYNTNTYNVVQQLQSTLKPFLEVTSTHEPVNNENIYRSTASDDDEQKQYVGLSLIRKENSNKLSSVNNTDEFTPSLSSNIPPQIITLINRFNTEERQCFNMGKIYYNGKCENLFSEDTCGIGKLLVLDLKSALLSEPKIVPKCIQNNCNGNQVYWPATKQCYALTDKNSDKLCLPGNKFERDYFSGYGLCKCKEYPTVYGEFINGTCYKLFTQGPCTESYIFVEENQSTKCIKNPCNNSSHVIWEDGDRKCYELNSVGQCGKNKIFKISIETLKPTCTPHVVPFTIVDVPEFCDGKIPGDCQENFKIKQGPDYIKRILLLAKKKLNKKN